VTDLHSCRKYYSQIFRLLKSLKILRMFICQAIKHYKELWMVETGLSHEPWKVWGLKLLSQQYGSGFTEIRSGNRISCPKSQTYWPNQVVPHQGWSKHLHSKEHLLTPALKDITRIRAERLLQWHAENGHKNILFTDEKIFTIKEQCNNHNKIYAQTSLEVRSEDAGMPSPFLPQGLVGGVPSGGITSSFLQERGETVVYVHSYCCLCILRCGYPDWGFSVHFPQL